MCAIRNSKSLKGLYFIFPIIITVLIVTYLVNASQNSFDETIFSVDNVYEHIKELTSLKYNGRLTGSMGNELSMKYVEDHFKKIGIEPGGDEGTYYQHFETIVPQIDTQPIFQIKNEKGIILEEFEMYEDYRLVSGLDGGGDRFEGEVLFAGKYLYKISPELIKDRIVVMNTHTIRDEDIEYVVENGGIGFLYTREHGFGWRENKNYKMKVPSSARKKGRTILLGDLRGETYNRLREYSNRALVEKEYQKLKLGSIKKIDREAGIVRGVKLKCDIDFPILKSSNILGIIEGKKKDGGYLIIGAHLDHVGDGPRGRYFPGALDNASGSSMMLELARVIKSQKNRPDKTIIFVCWNGEENGLKGSKYYVKNPIYPLEKTQVINLDCIGGPDAIEIILESTGDVGNIMRSTIYQYAEDLKIDTKEIYDGPGGSDHLPFIKANVPAVQIGDSYSNIHTYEDTIDNISKENLEKVGAVVTNYIKRSIFKDTLPDYLNKVELVLLLIFIIGIMFIYIVFSLNKIDPNMKIINVTVENIYYSSVFKLIVKCYYFMTPTVIILFSLIFIANLPQSFNFVFRNGEPYSNLSMYLVVKKSVLYTRNLILYGLGTTENNVKIISIVIEAMGRSFKLILAAIIISFVFGILKGIFDSYRDNDKGNLRTIGTISALSLPDVLIVLLGWLLIIYVAKHDMLNQYIDPKVLRRFIVPLLTLSIIPTVYVSRITFVAVKDEFKKDYISAAKARGLSKLDIYSKHLFNTILLKTIDSVPTLMTIMVSNLIIVEYLFNYKGVVFYLYKFYREHDINSFIGLSLALGLIYIIIIIASKLASKLINPMKKEVSLGNRESL